MFISLNFVFTLINFGTLIGLFVYVYYKYGRQMLIEHMAAQEEATHLLEQQEIALKLEEKRLQILIQDEQRIAAHLQEKLTRWRKAQDQKIADEQLQRQEIQKALHAKSHRQAQWYAQHKLASRLLPQVVAKVRKELDAKFAVPAKQDQYVQEILTYLTKSRS